MRQKKIVVEADTPDEALAALRAAPDVLQLDKFTLSRRQTLPARHLHWPSLHAGADWRHYPRLAGELSRLWHQALYHFRTLLRSTCGYQS